LCKPDVWLLTAAPCVIPEREPSIAQKTLVITIPILAGRRRQQFATVISGWHSPYID
jgi:hypothetical protein